LNACARAALCFRTDVAAHVGQAEQHQYVQTVGARSDLPGVMAGMVVTDASPLDDDTYQFTTFIMILVASGITAMLAIIWPSLAMSIPPVVIRL
jgi:ABC-type iron transport system FetAB permease component